MYGNAASAIRVPKTAEIIAGRIRKAIIRGQLKSGDRLASEAELVDEYQVSRPTVREAIRILESEGFLRISRGARGGAHVVAPGPELLAKAAGLTLQFRGATLADIYAARSVIEPPAARWAAELNSKRAAAALRKQLQREREVADLDAPRARAITDFHTTLLDECGNVALGMVGRALYDVVLRQHEFSNRRQTSATSEARRKQIQFGYRSQEKLIELIEARDGAAAEAHWIRHMKAAGDVWLYGISKTSVIDILD
ncbi:FCD domain-containing protein [Bradyrhizobium sp. LHD-71]|uniref:FadR/GntR family transcriptional regulator n=1 Tax=Bradyrhizobium sp. LHD-71 TaxID=3072141 RepID=UPI00280E2CB0|nr:FCD domain-containing protein [Bradyrhizobium sp. LHD-71]MDQ8728260.1 GntR family transcriptional regulator [Bradyrhizobium sp. LHD-71]